MGCSPWPWGAEALDLRWLQSLRGDARHRPLQSGATGEELRGASSRRVGAETERGRLSLLSPVTGVKRGP